MRPDPQQLLFAYMQGIFPMAHENRQIFWYDPDPRAIIPLDCFHVPARLARTVRRAPFQIHFDSAFTQVMERCAAGRGETWISEDLIAVYTELHRMGFAHSVEAWQGDVLVGGLYGVAINSFFAGESMFSLRRDASKVALVHLVRRLKRHHFLLLDIQFLTDHLAQFGATEISRSQYRRLLQRALQQPNRFN